MLPRCRSDSWRALSRMRLGCASLEGSRHAETAAPSPVTTARQHGRHPSWSSAPFVPVSDRCFRRRSATTTDAPGKGAVSGPFQRTADRPRDRGQGRPTPKRSEAEKRRRWERPADRKAAVGQSKARQRRSASQERGPCGAARSGPPPRKRARSRRWPGTSWTPGPLSSSTCTPYRAAGPAFHPQPGCADLPASPPPADGLGHGGRGLPHRQEAERAGRPALSSDSTRGVKMYAAMRALQIRKLRSPSPGSTRRHDLSGLREPAPGRQPARGRPPGRR